LPVRHGATAPSASEELAKLPLQQPRPGTMAHRVPAAFGAQARAWTPVTVVAHGEAATQHALSWKQGSVATPAPAAAAGQDAGPAGTAMSPHVASLTCGLGDGAATARPATAADDLDTFFATLRQQQDSDHDLDLVHDAIAEAACEGASPSVPQAEAMVLNLDDPFESSAAVLDLELERMTLEELQQFESKLDATSIVSRA
jgi:hypothetical protein